MEDILKHIEEIELYHEDKMNEEERAAFELALKNSQELREELELYLKVRNGLEALGEEKRLKSKLKEADGELDNKRKIGLWIPMGIAASVIGAIIVLYNVLQPSNDYKAISSKYYVADSGLPVFMGENDGVQFGHAMQLYKDGKYQDALSEFVKLNSSDTVTYYVGLCKLNTEQNSTQEFLSVFRNSKSIFQEKAGYYEALALLKSGDVATAKQFVDEISKNEHHPYLQQILNLQKEKIFSTVR